MSTKRKMFLDLNTGHVLTALTAYLISTSMIDDDTEVSALTKTPEGYQVKIVKE